MNRPKYGHVDKMENTKKYVVIKTLNEKMVLILIYNYKVNYKNKTIKLNIIKLWFVIFFLESNNCQFYMSCKSSHYTHELIQF